MRLKSYAAEDRLWCSPDLSFHIHNMFGATQNEEVGTCIAMLLLMFWSVHKLPTFCEI